MPDLTFQDITRQFDRWVRVTRDTWDLARELNEEIARTFDTGSLQDPLHVMQILPTIRMDCRGIICNGRLIPVARRPLARKLFAAFLMDPIRPLAREELVERVYGLTPAQQCSERCRTSAEQNLIKLISRTRNTADAATNSRENRWIEWFVYNADLAEWNLYRLTHSYLACKERERLRLMGTELRVPGGSPSSANLEVKAPELLLR